LSLTAELEKKRRFGRLLCRKAAEALREAMDDVDRRRKLQLTHGIVTKKKTKRWKSWKREKFAM
jgi:hypothetical protein